MPKRQCESDMENPREFAAWAFAAGIPDPRGGGYQSLIPAPCFPTISEMLWDFGFRHHADLQTKWVPDYLGPDRNIISLGTTDISPDDLVARATEMVCDQFPEVAAKLAQITPSNRDEMIAAQARDLLSSVERLRAASAQKGETQ